MTFSRCLLAIAAAAALLPAISACSIIDDDAPLDPRVLNVPGIENSGDRASQPGSAGANPVY